MFVKNIVYFPEEQNYRNYFAEILNYWKNYVSLCPSVFCRTSPSYYAYNFEQLLDFCKINPFLLYFGRFPYGFGYFLELCIGIMPKIRTPPLHFYKINVTFACFGKSGAKCRYDSLSQFDTSYKNLRLFSFLSAKSCENGITPSSVIGVQTHEHTNLFI